MKISIVIPVYNEATSLMACLQAIARQHLAPWEVIVVDNNSTDSSRAIASSFDFVKLITEPKQGVIHARSSGFDAVSGDIIARIDADSILPRDWTQSVEAVFEDSSIDAVSGVAHYYNVAHADFFNRLDLFFRRRLSVQLEDRVFLWGANMAMRKSAWLRVKPALCTAGGIHEDFDIAIHMQELGDKVEFDERLKASVSSRRIDTDYWSFLKYAWVSPKTYAKHDIKNRKHMYPVLLICAIGYLPARMLHKGYDANINSFSWSKFLAPTPTIARVDPTSNVA